MTIVLAAALTAGCGADARGDTAQAVQFQDPATAPAAASAAPGRGSATAPDFGAARTPTPDPSTQIQCMDGALLVTDVSIPDGTDLGPEQPFTKTWKLRNTGSCTWDSHYQLVFSEGDRLGAPDSLPLALTPPGATLDLSVDMNAPAGKGAFAALFEIRNPAGERVPVGKLKNIWVRITVGGGLDLSPPAQTAIAGTPPAPRTGKSGDCLFSENATYVQELANLINAARKDAELRPFKWNSQLAAAAQGHSLDMACKNFLNHRGSDGSWIGDRLAEAGYSTYNYSEIIAIGSPQDAMAQWRNSPSHWDSVLDASLAEFGVGYVYSADSNYGGYFTVDIASP